MSKKIFLWCVCLVLLHVPAVLPAADDGVTTFNLKVSTDYHLNQDGRPTPSYDFLVPLYADDESVLFFNPRYHVDDRTNLHQAEEWNLGLGYRHMIGDKAILGANVYYDWRRSMTGNQFEQIGAGLELLTENTTTRVNGYLALSGPAEVNRWREYYFAPRSLNYIDYVNYEVPQSGVDGEIGFKVPYLSDYCETWVYGGGYYFTDDLTPGIGDIKTKDMAGYKGRVEVKPTEWLSFEFEGRDDNVRGTDLYGQVSVEVPFSIENLVAGKNPFEGLKEKVIEPSYEVALTDRMYEKVERDPDVISGVSGDTAVNNGVSVSLSYVTPGTVGAGSGSWADPFVTLAYAIINNPAGRVIFVKSGTYNEAITVGVADTTIWGQGYKPSTITAMPRSLGVVLPVISQPFIINANNVEIMGLKFTGGDAGHATLSVNAGGSNARIHHNEFRPGPYAGVTVLNANGVIIDNNKFYITPTVSGNSSFGVYINNGIAITGPIITNNTFSVTRTGTTAYGSLFTEPGIAAIYAGATASIGTPDDPLTIIGNTITVADTNTSTTNGAPSVRGINLNVNNGTNIEDLYAYIANNKLTVSSTNLTTSYMVEGITAFAEDELHVTVIGNNLSGGVSGKNIVKGIALGEGYFPSTDRSYLIEGLVAYNKLKVANTATDDVLPNSAIGIYATLAGTGDSTPRGGIDLDIVANDLSLGVTSRGEAHGIRIRGGNANVSFFAIDNILKVTSAKDVAYGIEGWAWGNSSDLDAVIVGNNLSTGISTTGTDNTDNAYGIYLDSAGDGTNGGMLTADIGNNLLKVSSAAGDAYGIWEYTHDTTDAYSLWTTVFGNNLSTGAVSGKLNAYGILLDSATDATADIYNNSLKVSSTYALLDSNYGSAYGIKILAGSTSDIIGGVNYNNMSLGIAGKFYTAGIWLESEIIGANGDPFMISGNTLKVTSSADNATGVYLGAYEDVTTVVLGNNLSTGGVSGKMNVYGIALNAGLSSGGFGTLDATVIGNSLKVTSTYTGTTWGDGEAYGIYAYGDDGIFGDFSGNDLSPGVTGVTYAEGIWLDSDINGPSDGLIGGVFNPVTVSYNKLKVTASGTINDGLNIDALGIDLGAEGDIFAEIIGNDLSAGISGKDWTSGIYVKAGGNVGFYNPTSEADPILIAGNKIKTTSTYTGTTGTRGEAYGIYIGADDGDVLADVSGNNLSYGISGKYLTGGIVAYAPSGNVGAYWDGALSDFAGGYFTATGNILKVTSTAGVGAGISLFAGGDYQFSHESYLLAFVNKNDLSLGVTGNTMAGGIIAGVNPWDHSNLTDVVELHAENNLLKVAATYAGLEDTTYHEKGVAAGIYVLSSGDDASNIYAGIDAYLAYNNMSSGVSGKWGASGIQLISYGVDGINAPHLNYNTLKVTSASGGAAGIELIAPGGNINAFSIMGNTMTAGISGARDAFGIDLDTSGGSGSIAYTNIDLNSMIVTSAGTTEYGSGNAYGINLESGGDINNVSVYNNKLSGGITGKYDAVGILLNAAGSIGDLVMGTDVFVYGNALKVKSNNTAFVATPTPTHKYLVSGIHLEAGDAVEADVTMNDLSLGVTGYGSNLTNPEHANKTRGVWGISLVAGDSIGIYYPSRIANNILTVTNGYANALTTGAAGVYLDAGADVFASILNNNLKVKAYKNAAGGYITSDVTIGSSGTVYFNRNMGTVDGTLTGTGAERWLLYLNALTTTGNNVNWGSNFVAPVVGGWTGIYSNAANPSTGYGPVETNIGSGGQLTP